MREAFLPFARASVGEDEIAEVVDTLRSGWLTTGPKTKRFEDAFAAYVGAPAALGVHSCTAALHVALAALGIGSGDAVVTSSMTFCSTVHVIEQVGAQPLLCDVEPDTLNLDVRCLEHLLDDARRRGVRVRAVIPVHLYGHPADMDPILEIARRQGIAVVEDAAHALPAAYRGRRIGSGPSPAGAPPTLACFSFYATKNLTTGEGGMLVGDANLVEEARIWSLHGMTRDAWKRYEVGGSWYYEVVRPGFKYNMTDVQAAIGLHQLRRLDGFWARRREIAHRYTEAFADIEELETPVERADVEHAWHLYVLRLRTQRTGTTGGGSARDRLIAALSERNIGTSVHFIPVHVHPYYRDRYGYRPESFPVAHDAYARMVSLPIYPAMSDADVADVIDAVTDAVRERVGVKR